MRTPPGARADLDEPKGAPQVKEILSNSSLTMQYLTDRDPLVVVLKEIVKDNPELARKADAESDRKPESEEVEVEAQLGDRDVGEGSSEAASKPVDEISVYIRKRTDFGIGAKLDMPSKHVLTHMFIVCDDRKQQ